MASILSLCFVIGIAIASSGQVQEGGIAAETVFEGSWKSPLPDNWEVVFELVPGTGGEYQGTVITYLNGLRYMTQAAGEIRIDGRNLYMVSNPEANVVYEGILGEDGNEIRGALKYANGSSMPLTLTRVEQNKDTGGNARGVTEESSIYHMPEDRGDGIDTGSREEAGLAAAAVDSFLNAIRRGEMGEIHGVLIAKNGTLALEEYFQEYGMETPHRLHSCTKSVVSLLAGIASDDGVLPRMEEPLSALLPEWKSRMHSSTAGVTLNDLFTMTAGFQDLSFSFDHGDAWLDSLLPLPLLSSPGEQFRYDDTCSEILGMILRRCTGGGLDSFARARLFAPLGIEEFAWDKHPNGTVIAAEGLTLKPRDLLRIGMMVLQRGTWNGKQIVSESWIQSSTEPRVSVDSTFAYGRHWWSISGKDVGLEGDVPAAQGDGGQRLYIVPQYQAVCVITAGNFDIYPPIELFIRDILAGDL